MAIFQLELVKIIYFSPKNFEKSPVSPKYRSKTANFRPTVGCYTRPPLEIQKRPLAAFACGKSCSVAVFGFLRGV